MAEMNICRFCKGYMSHDSGVKYGRSHYAHFECFLHAGKSLDTLQAWQVGRFPVRVLAAHDLVPFAKQIMDRAEATQ